jgi:hypothetical protein
MPSVTELSLGHNVTSTAEVDTVMEQIKAMAATGHPERAEPR